MSPAEQIVEAKKAWKKQRRQQKFGNVRVCTDEGDFDSQREYRRWCELKMLERAGKITNLEHHVKFPFALNGVEIGHYEADFVYFENGQRVVEDSKGYATPEFKLKAKMMRAFFNIEVRCT